MTPKEKVKVYLEALEKAKDLLEQFSAKLKKSESDSDNEDERVRKAILAFIKFSEGTRKLPTREYSKWIEYLEKQKNTISYYEEKLDRCVCENFNKGIREVLLHPEEYGLVKQQEQKPAQWSDGERIRKTLVAIVKWLGFDSSFFTDNSVTKSEVLAWLEKQKEPVNVSVSTMIPSCWEEKQKEQPEIDLEKEVEKFCLEYDSRKEVWFDMAPRDKKMLSIPTWSNFAANIARDFYELGLTARKKK